MLFSSAFKTNKTVVFAVFIMKYGLPAVCAFLDSERHIHGVS